MHLLLTDRLTCPRCGPTFGLILLADRMVDRRVHEGTLGCPNCRDAFAIEGGFADLRAPPRGEMPDGVAGGDPADPGGRDPDGSADDDPERRVPHVSVPGPGAAELVALLGIRRGPGTVVTVGRAARHARAIAGAVEDLQTVAVDPDTREWRDVGSVSRMVTAPGLPFFSQMMRGAVVDGATGVALIREAARIVAPKSRVVVIDAPEDTREVLEEDRLTVLAEEAGTVVATRA